MSELTFMQRIIKARVQILASGISKDKSGYKFKYVDLPQIEEKVLTACSENDLFTWIDYNEDVATLQIFDARNSESAPFSISVRPKDCETGQSPIQGTGAMMTYMRRYLYMTAFTISEHDRIDDQVGPVEAPGQEVPAQKAPEKKLRDIDEMLRITDDMTDDQKKMMADLIEIREIAPDWPEKMLIGQKKESFLDLDPKYVTDRLFDAMAKKKRREEAAK